jgi:ATP-dependent exoDNAse (exonuclease V) alpha subunit
MEVMVTFNVNTDLDIANGSRGQIVDICLNEQERNASPNDAIVELEHQPLYVLVKLSRMKASHLEGLGEGVIPICPLERTYSFQDEAGITKTVTRRQMPMTGAYAFTDYRAQGQTIDPVVIDIAQPPTGRLTACNAYVALSRGRSRGGIRLLHDFDDKLFTRHPCEHLRNEDVRLQNLRVETEKWWDIVEAKRAAG